MKKITAFLENPWIHGVMLVWLAIGLCGAVIAPFHLFLVGLSWYWEIPLSLASPNLMGVPPVWETRLLYVETFFLTKVPGSYLLYRIWTYWQETRLEKSLQPQISGDQ